MTGAGKRWLESTASMSVPRRLHTIAGEARRLAGTAELDRLLAELGGGDRYERLTAIRMAELGGARDHLFAQLDSADPGCVNRALAALVRMGVEPAVVSGRLAHLSHRTRKYIRRALAAGDREELAAALLPQLRTLFGDGEAARVLPYCPAATVRALLPELGYAVPNWAVLGHRHIEVVFEQVEAMAADAGRDDWREWWGRLTADAVAAVEFDPDRLLALSARAVEWIPIGELNPVAGRLARHDADAVHRLITHPTGNGRGLAGPALWRAMRELPDERLAELYRACPVHRRQRFLTTLPPARRAALAGPLIARPGLAPALVDLAVLDAIPRRERIELVRSLLARPGSEVPGVADALHARLPWPEAEPRLAEAIRRPTAEERALAYTRLATAAAGSRDPEVVGTMLGMLGRLRNEQDPVRSSALQAVNKIPASLWRTAHLPALEQLAEDALQARDRSYQTTSAVGELARTLLLRGAATGDTAYTDVSLRMLTRLAELSSTVNLYGLHRNLPRGAEQRLYAALSARLRADADRDRWDLAIRLATGLDRRAFALPELQRLLVRACSAHSDDIVRRALPLALANPATRDAHLDEILGRDRSLIALPEVRNLIAYRRTDLLDLLLSKSTAGRFLSKKIRFVPMFATGFGNWPPAQVERYARLLDTYARSTTAGLYERAGAVRQLGRLPGSFTWLYGHLNSPDLVIVEAALTALGSSDEPARAIALLSGFVDGDRARVAVSAIAACARDISADELSGTLAPLVDSRKVTAAKEGLRLLAALRAPDAMDTITEVWNRPDTHRDVRRAAVFATRSLFDRTAAWQLLTEAAADPESATAVLEITPGLLPPPQRPRFAAFLRDLAAAPDPRIARQALNALTRWHRWTPPGTGDLLVGLLTDLNVVGLWGEAGRALLAALVEDGDPTALTTAVTVLRDSTVTLPDRDLPARQRLSALLDFLAATIRVSDTARSAAPPVIALLAADPFWHPHLIDIAMAAVRWTETEATVSAIDALAPYATGILTGRPADRLSERVASEFDNIPAGSWTALAAPLASSSRHTTALAAVPLIAQCGKRFGWTNPWTDLLFTLRAHPDTDVRRAAGSVYTASE
ncbi:hypothetical protein LTV02_10185 [Nocardia yamanashiensis]|uniref:hypothetical protein n=1 Tax=Nocardia yamanashiensis TaxID=209247 RepID=UPI001E4DAE9C|nr:hypothetical protein [Nocardia yamanashiensis]UGT43721.1 hypothetical protein LTV02_10185 [Nocardia yamanashiensis]